MAMLFSVKGYRRSGRRRALGWHTASLLAVFLWMVTAARAQEAIPGAAQMKEYLPLLQGKRVGVIINQTSRVGNALLADTLQRSGVHLVKIFVPEHGFRGVADAGAHVNGGRDSTTGLPIISLYGDNKKPRPEQLQDIDILIYDLQDVGVRFYTYISTLQYAMEACAENGKQLMVLDRPNPNGHYVDGPVLDTALRSFVGMQPVPIVYGMTSGEYARMLQGERRFRKAASLNLKVIPCRNWDHRKPYSLPVPPSPNLRTDAAVYLYPSLCLFEGTVVSVGRGTDKPFMQWGHPLFEGKTKESFRPASVVGATHPPYEGQTCYGRVLDQPGEASQRTGFRLEWLLQAYQWYPDKDKFFTDFFEKLAGTRLLRRQIQQGMTEQQIRSSWEPQLAQFKKIRKKYLLYRDFES